MLLKKNIPWTYIFGKIKYELLTVAAYAILVAIAYHQFHFTRISVPLSVPSILGTIISLLLAFRSNQAYDRWWEARIVWGAIVNDSRSLARQASTFLTGDMETEPEVTHFRERFVRRQIAWCYNLANSLRGNSGQNVSDKHISRREQNLIKSYDNSPNALLDLHGQDLKYALQQGWLNEYQQGKLDETLTRLCDSMGKCERIKKTVFPTTYSMYIHFSIILFIMFLPFSLIQIFGVMEVILVVAIAATFLLVEKMAIHLQDPFENKPTDTPMTSICRTIERDLKQVLKHNDYELPELHGMIEKKFYVM